METISKSPPRPRLSNILAAALLCGFGTTAPAAVLWEQLPTRSSTDQNSNYNYRTTYVQDIQQDYEYRSSSYSRFSGSHSTSYRYTRSHEDTQVYLDDFSPQKRWQLTEGETWGWSYDDYALGTVNSFSTGRTEHTPWDGGVSWSIHANPEDAGLDPQPIYAGFDSNATRSTDDSVNLCPVGNSCGTTGYHYSFSFGDDVFLDAGVTYWIQIAALEHRTTERFGTNSYHSSGRYSSFSSRTNYDVGTNLQTYREFNQALAENSGNSTRVFSRPEHTQTRDYHYGGTDTTYVSPDLEQVSQNQGELAFRLLGSAIGNSSSSTVTASEPGTALALGIGFAVLLGYRRRRT